MRIVVLGVAGVAGLIVGTAAVKVAGGPSAVTITGAVTPSFSASYEFGTGMNATSYAECAVTSPKPGTQVTITDPSGKVIGTAALGLWDHTHATASGLTVYQCEMPFTIKNVPAEQRYGFSVAGENGTIWETNVSLPVDLST